jgi:serine/threonine protein phosphatase 1
VTYYLELEENRQGRDFVVGDIHGCLDLLKEKLERAQFNPEKDRLFSVGDLVDRGPQSFETLMLLEQPWFHNVMGNHDDMLLSYLHIRHSSHFGPSDFLANGGRWILELTLAQKDYLLNILAPILEGRPYVMHVKGKRPFNVVHAEVYTARRTEIGFLTDAELADEETIARTHQILTWGRQLFKQKILPSPKLVVRNDRFLDLGGEKVPGLSPTYVGHSICPCPVKYAGHYFLDGGAFTTNWPDEQRFGVGGKLAGALFMYNHTDKKFVT